MGNQESNGHNKESSTGRIACTTLVETFTACHCLHSDALSKEDNLKVYGECNNPNAHGYNFKLEFTLKGPISEETGVVMSIPEMKEIVHQAMNMWIPKDVSDLIYLRAQENLAIYLWRGFIGWREFYSLLYEIKVYETDKKFVSYKGE